VEAEEATRAATDGPGVNDAWAATSGEEKGLSLRSRLAGAAASKKPRNPDHDRS
jgi:hypothetical protein